MQAERWRCLAFSPLSPWLASRMNGSFCDPTRLDPSDHDDANRVCWGPTAIVWVRPTRYCIVNQKVSSLCRRMADQNTLQGVNLPWPMRLSDPSQELTYTSYKQRSLPPWAPQAVPEPRRRRVQENVCKKGLQKYLIRARMCPVTCQQCPK
ncbi:hypothetical protein F5Y18DRAFT_373496 [Xylariaceae sp. FL1019]|nr:hypothetical protein F5Y18DRAFT_373496 [Xylariaceae sp. FL1019]